MPVAVEPPRPSCSVPVTAWRNGDPVSGERAVPEETAIALTFGHMTYAVMMATPNDLEDFAFGFSLNERVVRTPGEIEDFAAIARPNGIELRMIVADMRMDALLKRRRYLTGATGCGLCGMESLAETAREPPAVPQSSVRWPAAALAAIPDALTREQQLNRTTRATHAAALWTEHDGIVAVREDVGRHNALDKLAGALARAGTSAETGVVVLTSRISVEMVQKAAQMGASTLMAVSVPTALALRVAERSGITIVGVARSDGFEVFTHPGRVTDTVSVSRPANIMLTP